MITGFNHTSFTVTDIHKAVRFWTENLGFEVASVSPRTGGWQEEVTGVAGASLLIAHLHGHGHHVELVQYLEGAVEGAPPPPSSRCAAHVCFEVDDIERTWSELLAAGATGQGRIAEVDSGPVEGCKAGYLRDPNGIIIELVEMTR